MNHRARTKAIVGGMLIENTGGNGRRTRHTVAYLFVVVKQAAMIRILGLGTVVVVLFPISAGEDAMDAAHPGLRLRLGPELTASAARCGGTRTLRVVESLACQGKCSSTPTDPIQSDTSAQAAATDASTDSPVPA